MAPSYPCPSKPTARGFTLVELLVVIAIIGLLVAIAVPAVQQAVESARRTTCINNQRQIALALMNHHGRKGQFPAGWRGRGAGGQDEVSAPTGWGWAAMILPEVEQSSLHDRLDYSKSILDPANAAALESSLAAYLCPSDEGERFWDLPPANWQTASVTATSVARFPSASYVGNFGALRARRCEDLAGQGRQCLANPFHGVFSHNSRTELTEIRDGVGNTILIGERMNDINAEARMSTWVGVAPTGYRPFDRVLASAEHSVNDSWLARSQFKFDDFGSHHGGGAYFAFCDGRVEFIDETIDHLVYVDLTTIDSSQVRWTQGELPPATPSEVEGEEGPSEPQGGESPPTPRPWQCPCCRPGGWIDVY